MLVALADPTRSPSSSAPPALPQCSAMLVHYGFASLPAPAAATGGHSAAAAAAQANAAADRAALSAGLVTLGRHLGLCMDDSWERGTQRDAQRTLNASATATAHALRPLGGPAPPFGPPAQFPATAGAFRGMSLAEARALGTFYGLPPPTPAAGGGAAEELALRRANIAVHIGFRG